MSNHILDLHILKCTNFISISLMFLLVCIFNLLLISINLYSFSPSFVYIKFHFCLVLLTKHLFLLPVRSFLSAKCIYLVWGVGFELTTFLSFLSGFLLLCILASIEGLHHYC